MQDDSNAYEILERESKRGLKKSIALGAVCIIFFYLTVCSLAIWFTF